MKWVFHTKEIAWKRYLALKLNMGCFSRKNPNRWGWGHTFLKKNPEIFRFVTLPLEILQRKQSFIPGKSTKLCDMVTPLGNSNTKNQNPWKFLMILYWSPLEISHFFFNWLLEFPQALSSIYLLKFHVLNLPLPCLDFFWNSPILLWWLWNTDKLINRNYADIKILIPMSKNRQFLAFLFSGVIGTESWANMGQLANHADCLHFP